MKVIVGIQARMSSTRLPGKVLADICGVPMIRRVWDSCEGPWKRMVLTTIKQEDDELVEFLLSHSMDYRRGSEPDVLSRYAQLAAAEKPHCLVRVCGDAPLMRSEWIKAAVDLNAMVFVPQILHAGSWIAWDEANRYSLPTDWEHAGYHWFEGHSQRLDLVPPDYMTVNTQEDLDEVRRRFCGK